MPSILLLTAAIGTGSAPDADAASLVDVSSLRYRHDAAGVDPVLLSLMQDVGGDAPGAGESLDDGWVMPPPPRFGAMGSNRWTIQAGYGVEFDDTSNSLSFLGVGMSHFVADNISLDLEFNGMFFGQRGEDAGGINFNLLVRWHFYETRYWTLYFDGGAGLLWTNEDVPFGTSKFNFTPQAGLGASFDIGKDLRLMFGGRWHHISNAELEDSNTGRDSIMGYVMISVPF